MNKYQEALKELREEIISKITIGFWNANKIEDCLRTLQQAIDKTNKYDDKETPKKVLKNTNYDNCPVCYMPLVDYDKDDVSAVYCKYCGQRMETKEVKEENK